MKRIKYMLLMLILICPFSYKALEIKDLNSPISIIYNLDEDKIIYENNSEEVTSIASLTKIMTAITAIENIPSLSDKVKITYEMLEDVPWDASVAGLQVNDTVTYKDLLYALLLPSGADAADALAVSLFGSVDVFVDKMNELAQKLNLENTHFVNTTGYDEYNHYSTAKDVLTILKYALTNETFKEVYETRNYTTTNYITLDSTINYLNRGYNYDLSFVKGSKTGTTDEAGLCLSTLSEIEGTNIITITLNAKEEYGKSKNLEDLISIYNQVKDGYDRIDLVKENDDLVKLKTKYAKELEISIPSPITITRYLPVSYDKDKLKIEYTGEEIIKNTTKKGTKVGLIKVYYDDELLEEIPAITPIKLHFSLWEYLKTNIVYYLILFVLVVLTIHITKSKKKKRRK